MGPRHVGVVHGYRYRFPHAWVGTPAHGSGRRLGTDSALGGVWSCGGSVPCSFSNQPSSTEVVSRVLCVGTGRCGPRATKRY